MTSRSREEDRLLSAALAYADRGWPVFPLKPQDKTPITKNGVKDATTIRSRVLLWWQSVPDANIGLACGTVFDVLDVDGSEAVPTVQDLLGATYTHDGPVAITGRESTGLHLYFQSVPGSGNRAGMLGSKIDYRGSGGYVVAPPSIHPSGRAYRWDKHRDANIALPVAPEALQDLVLRAVAEPITTPQAIKLQTPAEPRLVTAGPAAEFALKREDITETVSRLGAIIVKRGSNLFINCLFHDDRNPSMQLYPDNTFYCHGCDAKGDSINLNKGQDMTGRKFSG